MAEHWQKIQSAAFPIRRGVVVPHGKAEEGVNGDDVAAAIGKGDDSSPSRADKAILARWAAWRPETRSSTADRRSRERELSELAGVRIVSKLGNSFLGEPLRPKPSLARTASEALRRWREIEDESGRCLRKGIGTDAAAGGEGQQRVREMARKWMNSVSDGDGGGEGVEIPKMKRRNGIVKEEMDICRERGLDGREAANGRTGRRFLQLRGREVRLELIMRAVKEREKELQHIKGFRRVSSYPFRSRLQSLLRGRLFHFATPFGEEKRTSSARMELIQLRDQHPVTLLREGFTFGFENTRHHHTSNDNNSTCAGNSSGPVMDRSCTHIVTGALGRDPEPSQSRNEYSDIDYIVENQTMDTDSSTMTQNIFRQLPAHQEISARERTETSCMEWEPEREVDFMVGHADHGEESDANLQQEAGHDLPEEPPGDHDEDGDHSEMQETSHETAFNLAIENLHGHFGTSTSEEQPCSIISFNASLPLDYCNGKDMELRQLVQRRSVSNIRSEFRDSLNQLVRSFIERKNRPQSDWDLQQHLRNLYSSHDNGGWKGGEPMSEHVDPVWPIQQSASPTVQSYPICSQDRDHSLVLQSMHQSQIKSEDVNDLRAEVVKVHEGMSQIQKMLESCLDMQQELQKSIRQEVSSALNRYLAGKGIEEALKESWTSWVRTRKGTCCICCDSPIDSLLYRCGHMCTCYQCGSEVLRNEGKCPLCRAPVVEVIRAYSSVR